MDFGKYFYHKEKKAREAKKRQHEVQVKEVKFGPNTEEHDYNFKMRNALKFLKQKNKVKFTIRFKGRQLAHKDRGFELLEKIRDDIKELIEIDSKPKNERITISMVVAPKKGTEHLIQEYKQKFKK